jgi:hypothetical protein
VSERGLNRASFVALQKLSSIGHDLVAAIARRIVVPFLDSLVSLNRRMVRSRPMTSARALSSTEKQMGGGMFTVRRMMCVGLASYCLAACAEVQMDYNALTYDGAIADSANQLLLLNAVRASQHYPRSFTSAGAVVGGPPVTGGIGSTFNFNQFSSLQNFSLTPAIAATGGYSQFNLSNLNFQEFMTQMRKPVDPAIIKAFSNNPNWPRQLLDLFDYQYFGPTAIQVHAIDSRRKEICGSQKGIHLARESCKDLDRQIAQYTERCRSYHFTNYDVRAAQFRDDDRMYYNTASNYCHFARFKIFLEEVRLTKAPLCPGKPGCLFTLQRSPLDMIGYLGELIAAQNYIDDPFIPLVQIGIPVADAFEFRNVPMFVVVRGEPLGNAAVVVRHNGVPFYIPRPDFGSPFEERSLQTLELVLQTVQAATTQKDVPAAIPPVAVLK